MLLPLLRSIAIPALVISTILGAGAGPASASTLRVACLVAVLVTAAVSLLALPTVVPVVIVIPALRAVAPVVVPALAVVLVVIVPPVATATRPLLLGLTRSHRILAWGKNIFTALWQVVAASEKVNLQSTAQTGSEQKARCKKLASAFRPR